MQNQYKLFVFLRVPTLQDKEGRSTVNHSDTKLSWTRDFGQPSAQISTFRDLVFMKTWAGCTEGRGCVCVSDGKTEGKENAAERIC